MILTVLVFILTLGVLVLVHEFGHYFAAKKFNVKVLEFGFGLPPKLWGKKIGETIYSLNWLPIGGFVRLLGEDEVPGQEVKKPEANRWFSNQPVWQRIVVVVAGVVMNLLLATVLFYGVLGFSNFKEKIPLLVPHNFVGVSQVDETLGIFIGEVAPNSPAQKAGMISGERIAFLNGQNVSDEKVFIEEIKRLGGQEVTLLLEDNQGKSREVKVSPRVDPPPGEGSLGVRLGSLKVANLAYETPTQKALSGFYHSYNLTAYSMKIFGRLLGDAFKTRDLGAVSESVAGPVGITQMTGTILSTENPIIPYLNFVALLSLNLAVVNILPFPALDGGRLIFLVIEGVFRKKVKAEVERWVHTAGMAILLTLIILITVSDLKKIFF
ncbi:MAG: M50 family metallopeptidase [Candidatus Daviesbacteria bacterium]|nr:M50 family metallopeptidase [Candidatus Daviesbacteria bacterium]